MVPLQPCPEFIDDRSPQGVEVYQVTTDFERSGIVYPDRVGFLQSGRSMLLTTSEGPQICHLDQDCALQPLSDMVEGMRWFRLAPDGRHLIYGCEDARPNELRLRRLDLQTGETEEVFAAGGELADTSCPVGRVSLETVSYDASRIGGLAYLDCDRKPDGETGIVILDTARGTMDVISNQPHHHSHLRYFPGKDEPGRRSLMVQHNHDRAVDEKGRMVKRVWDAEDRGVDLHVIGDDGTGWGDLPFGRDGVESCIGHQVWRAPHYEVAAIMYQNQDNSYGWADGTRQHLVTGAPVACDPRKEHRGRVGRDEDRHLLSQKLDDPRLCHLACDGTGLRFAFDTFPVWNGDRAGMEIYIGNGETLTSPLEFHYILNSGVVFISPHGHNHAHPILSPNGSELFFTSDYFGSPQAYMVKNLPWGQDVH
jgi:hypothetical protein